MFGNKLIVQQLFYSCQGASHEPSNSQWNNFCGTGRCTLSSKDPLQIVLLKGTFSGIGSILIGLLIGEKISVFWSIPAVLCIGFVAYGLSIYFYVYAQRILGAARTSSYYAIAPFIAVLLSFLVFRDIPGISFFVALFCMGVGVWLTSKDA